MLHIFTDGACPSNGKRMAKAAYSVVLWNLPGETKPIGVAKQVPANDIQTNQRAELLGLKTAFNEIVNRGLKGPITIWTDSEYARKCVTEWGPQWKVRGWKRNQNAKKPIEHLDILKEMIDFYENSQHFVKIQHITAHTNKKEFPYCGNAMADELASRCAQENDVTSQVN